MFREEELVVDLRLLCNWLLLTVGFNVPLFFHIFINAYKISIKGIIIKTVTDWPFADESYENISCHS